MDSKKKLKNKSRSSKDKTGSSPYNGRDGQVEPVVQNSHPLQNENSAVDVVKDTELRLAGVDDLAEKTMGPLKATFPPTSTAQGSKVLSARHIKVVLGEEAMARKRKV